MSRDRLTAAEFHILLALADGDRHGLGIVEEVESRTDGEMRLGPGLLYGSLKRMGESGWVRDAPERPSPELDDPRRRYLRITGKGRVVLGAEARRWARVLAVAEAKDVLGGTAGQ